MTHRASYFHFTDIIMKKNYGYTAVSLMWGDCWIWQQKVINIWFCSCIGIWIITFSRSEMLVEKWPMIMIKKKSNCWLILNLSAIQEWKNMAETNYFSNKSVDFPFCIRIRFVSWQVDIYLKIPLIFFTKLRRSIEHEHNDTILGTPQ